MFVAALSVDEVKMGEQPKKTAEQNIFSPPQTMLETQQKTVTTDLSCSRA